MKKCWCCGELIQENKGTMFLWTNFEDPTIPEVEEWVCFICVPKECRAETVEKSVV